MRRLRTLSVLAILSSLSLTLLLTGEARAWWTWTPGDTVDNTTSLFGTVSPYKPDQPIPFSHKLHAGDRKIPCQYCHSSARRSITSGIPPLNTCMGCHKVVATDRPNIQKLAEHFNTNKPIEWVKVHDLPDFVRFSHQMHVTKAGLQCQDCHGAVETMDVVEQGAPLQMGWCVECHKAKGAKLDCFACHY